MLKERIGWLNAALETKSASLEMKHYRVQDGEMRATNGRITAGCPIDLPGNFLVPGNEIKRLLAKLAKDPTAELLPNGALALKAGRFKGTINTLAVEGWQYPGVDAAAWEPVPPTLIDTVRALRPFISDNPTQQWAAGVALEGGWAYATNNIALAGAACPGLAPSVSAILPVWAVDFVLSHRADLVSWAWGPDYVAFRWANGAWLRSALIDGKFNERAGELIRKAWTEEPAVAITDEFREALERVGGLAENLIAIHTDRIEGNFGQAVVEEGVEVPMPDGKTKTMWGASYLIIALHDATHWQPTVWPKPVPFKGGAIAGYVVGRTG